MDTECDSNQLAESGTPFELLSLAERNGGDNSHDTPASAAITESVLISESNTLIPDFGVISQSIELISTGSTIDEPVSTRMAAEKAADLTSILMAAASSSLFSSIPDISVTAPGSSLKPVEIGKNTSGPLDSFGDIFRQVGAERSHLEATVFPGTSAYSDSFSLQTPHGSEIPAAIHRSVSSPIFGSTSRVLSLESTHESENDSNMSSKSDQKRAKRRKPLLVNLKFPEAEPPAQRPRFQWYQGKGVIRIHLLVKNVLPENLSYTCTGRDLVFRCQADGSPFPPTRTPDTIPLPPLVEYHLPLRLPHRVYPDPEFTRISPTRVEVYYKKVKPQVEWSCLWKSVSGKPSVARGDGDANVSSSDSEDEMDVESADENEEARPSKRFMNGGGGEEVGRRENGPLSEAEEIAAASLASFTVGVNLEAGGLVASGMEGDLSTAERSTEDSG